MITDMIQNPVTSNTSRLYYKSYSSKSSPTANSTISKIYAPVRFSAKDLLSSRSSENVFSETTVEALLRPSTARGGDINSISSNMNRRDNSFLTMVNFQHPNLSPKTHRSIESRTLSIGSGKHISHLKMDRNSRSFPYCDPILNTITISSVTNIAYCKDRHFFDQNEAAVIIPDGCNEDNFSVEQRNISSETESDCSLFVLAKPEASHLLESATKLQLSNFRTSGAKGGIAIEL